MPSLLVALHQRRSWRRATVLLGMAVILTLLAWNLRPNPLWALAALALLLIVYPVSAWRDAPLFPTGQDSLAPLEGGPWQSARQVLDLGSGLGDGLIALRRIFPLARLTGVEMSRLLVVLSQLRCPWARIVREDMWAIDWSGFDLVYVFQRPETMARLWDKAHHSLAPGAWVISFQFPVSELTADWSGQNAQGRWLFAYRVAPRPAAL